MNYYTDVLKKYAVFSGRARRKEYWMFFLFNFIIGVVLGIVSAMTSSRDGSSPFSFIYFLYALAVVIPSLAVSVRRLHDTNHSGWWLFIDLVPLVGWIILLVFLVGDGNPSDNKYGPNPKGIAATAS